MNSVFETNPSEVGRLTKQWPFWQVQCAGWFVFAVITFPLKWIVFGSIYAALVVTVYREGVGLLVTSGMHFVYQRFYREQMAWFRLGALILLVSLVGTAVQATLCFAFHDILDFEEEKIFKEGVVFAVIYFRAGLSLGWSLLYFGCKLYDEREGRKLRIARTELQLLRAQINSHFLFNALNTILSALELGRKNLREMLQALADYLNYSLRNRHDTLVTLGDEVDALADYLILEKARIGSTLDISMRIDERARAVPVPGIILQPLVENAIKFGRETSPKGTCIRVDIAIDGTSLVIEVANMGRWIPAARERTSGGVGLENIRARLALHYTGSYHMETTAEEEWVCVRILLPNKNE